MKSLLAHLLRIAACTLNGHTFAVVGHGLARCGSCGAAILDVSTMYRGLAQMVKEKGQPRYWS